MARRWRREDLEGVKDGVNKQFTVPSLPTNVLQIWIFWKAQSLKRVDSSPQALQFAAIGNFSIQLGDAPASSDDLWTQYVYDDLGLPDQALALLRRIDRTFVFSVRIYNKAGELVELIDRDVLQINWSYTPTGGCQDASVTLRRPFDQPGDVKLEYWLEIWREIDLNGVAGARLPAILGAQGIELGSAFTGVQARWWGGFIREIQPSLNENEEAIELRCSGWSRQLEYIIVPRRASPWQNMDAAAIARDIIDTYVLPGSKIKRTSTLNLAPDVGVMLDSFNAETTAARAIALLAEIAGNAEWGVRADREFFFLRRTNEIKQIYLVGDRIALYQQIDSADEIVNRVYLRGANDVLYTLASNLEAGYYKERSLTIPSISSASVATLWGSSYFARYGSSVPSGRLTIAATDEQIEAEHYSGRALGVVRVVGGPVVSGGGDRLSAQLPIRLAQTYGSYTDTQFRIAGVRYSPGDDALNVEVSLGERNHSLADYLTRIEYRLQELQQARVL
jgi:hypothetical protein